MAFSRVILGDPNWYPIVEPVETYSLYASDEERKYFVVEMSTQGKFRERKVKFIYDRCLFIQLHVTVTPNGHISNVTCDRT